MSKLNDEIMSVLVKIVTKQTDLVNAAKELEKLIGTDPDFSIEINEVKHPLNKDVHALILELHTAKENYLTMLTNVGNYMAGIEDVKVKVELNEKTELDGE